MSRDTQLSAPLALLSFVGTVAIIATLIQKQLKSEKLKSFQSFSSSSSSTDSQQSEPTTPQHESSSNHPSESLASSLPSPEQTLALIQNRRSIFTKQFSGNSVPRSVIQEMLEATRWAPNHHITEPWRFIVFESLQARQELGQLLGDLYRKSCAPDDSNLSNNEDIMKNASKKKKPFLQAKYDKKLKGAKLSSHIIAICVKTSDGSGKKAKSPFVEEVCSVAMAVQNMHLIATAHGVGAYWSSGGVHGGNEPGDGDGSPSSDLGVVNPLELTQFLHRHSSESMSGGKENTICLGWFYVGDYYGNEPVESKKWPSGRRGTMDDKTTWL